MQTNSDTLLPVIDRIVAPTELGAGATPAAPWPTLCLPFGARSRSRLRATLSDGREVALLLPRGSVLRGGALIAGVDLVVRVVAADEDLVEVRADSATALARAAYHLGNRHVPVEVGDGVLKLEYDSVLVDMLVGLGVRIRRTWSPFEPEHGAYGGGHSHGH